MKSRLFVDVITIHAIAGDGGNGCSSFRREKFVPKGGPDGGDGGDGGNVIFMADSNTDSLVHLYYQPEQRAERGEHGKGKQQHGRKGRDLIIKVPCGTEIFDNETSTKLAELINDKDTFLALRGGKGGLGNINFKSSTRQAPEQHTNGEKGQEGYFRLEMKTIADIGLVGFPNSGKSSLLAALTSAHPKIGHYPFTTLHPIVGTLVENEWTHLTIVDIPGIITDAHKGIGLGHDFLRHIERTSFLLFIIDMAGSDGRNPVDDYKNLKKELRLYRKDLLKKPFLVVANKMDLPNAHKNLSLFKKKTRINPLKISALTGEGIPSLKKKLFMIQK